MSSPPCTARRPDRPLAGRTPSAETRPGARHPTCVLIIEDNADTADSLADLLELAGHRVQQARDGRSGVRLAHEIRPDVVLCDIGLPDVDGYAVARALREDCALAETRLVALSGYVQAEDRRRATDSGFDTHVAKPPDIDALIRAVEGVE